ncbi:MAG: response regulator [Clostridia bacterium]|nr:response regulator [Clostridia bacterium]
MKYIKCFFIIISILVFSYVIIGQTFLPEDNLDTRNISMEYTENWYKVKSEGVKEVISVPGNIEQNYIIETVIPDNLDGRVTSMCVRCEDVNAYLDGELIYEYSTRDTRWFGSISPESYINIPLTTADAGKTLRLEGVSDTGILYQPYVGTELGIWIHLLRLYSGELFVAAVTLIVGILTIIVSAGFSLTKRRRMDIIYLGCGVTLAAIWLITNSVFRQIVFPNVSVASEFPFFVVMLIPFPFIIYMNEIQNQRYLRMYQIAGTVLAVIASAFCLLYVAGIYNLIDMFKYVAAGCFFAIFTIFVTFIMDYRNGKIKEYKPVAIGLMGALIAAIIQFVIYFNRTGVFRGYFLAVGLLLLLGGAVIYTINNIFSMEKDKKAAVIANEAKGKFLASMSHEIRTPINAVLGMDEMILRESREPAIREYALDIQSAGKSLLSIINGILDISKIDSGKMEIIPVEYDLSSLIHDTLSMVSIKAKSKELEVNSEIDENIPSRLLGDDIRIKQILTNILNNAVKYTEKGSVTLIIKGDVHGDKICLHFEVKDTGIGIKEEDIPKLYEQFTRIEEARNRNIEGTGLGINITVRLLSMMNSHLNVKSIYGEGSCFYFDLEQKIIDSKPIGNLSERIREQEVEYIYETAFTAPDANMLIVDDNAVNRKVFKNLIRDTGIKIDEADSGEHCLDKVLSKKYDLIFIDHMMPGMDGIETLKTIRKLKENKNADTPYVAFTANAVTGAKEMYLHAGFDDFLTKPLIYEKLEKIILKYLPKEKVITKQAQDRKAQAKIPDVMWQDSSNIMDILNSLPEIDMEYALLHYHRPADLYNVIADFIKVIDSEADALEAFKAMLPDEEGLKQYRVKVHSMKASAAMIGAVYLSGMARMLELAAINKRLDIIEQVTPAFVEEWRSFKEKLKPVSDAEALSSDSEKIPVNKELIVEQMGLLNQAMDDMDIDRADEIVQLLKGFDYSAEDGLLMEQLYAAVSNIDNERVMELTKAYIKD